MGSRLQTTEKRTAKTELFTEQHEYTLDKLIKNRPTDQFGSCSQI